jgi:hypothetical protein
MNISTMRRDMQVLDLNIEALQTQIKKLMDHNAQSKDELEYLGHNLYELQMEAGT